MSNYPYIIAGLPDILLDFESRPFDFDVIKSGIVALCDKNDVQKINWLVSALDGKHYSSLFYKELEKIDNRFIQEYIGFDKEIRNSKVRFLKDGSVSEPSDEKEKSELSVKLEAIFKISNIIEREKALDKLYWEKINEITLWEYLSFDIILAFIAKAKLVDRWNKLDKANGALFFKQLVHEVRGTFKGVEYE